MTDVGFLQRGFIVAHPQRLQEFRLLKLLYSLRCNEHHLERSRGDKPALKNLGREVDEGL